MGVLQSLDALIIGSYSLMLIMHLHLLVDVLPLHPLHQSHRLVFLGFALYLDIIEHFHFFLNLFTLLFHCMVFSEFFLLVVEGHQVPHCIL